MIAELAPAALTDVGAIRVQVGGGSMAPLLPDHSVVVVERVAPSEIRRADTVLLEAAPERLLLHRVLRIRRSSRGRQFLIKGDRLGCCDGWYDEGAVLGRMTRVQRPGGDPIAGAALALLNWLGLALSTARAAGVLVMSRVRA